MHEVSRSQKSGILEHPNDHLKFGTLRSIVTLQVKYAIEAVRRICMAEGSMGPKAAKDVVWNDTVNTKGEQVLSIGCYL